MAVRYVGVGPEQGEIVWEEDAYEYALDRCLHGSKEDQEEFKEMLVEWFYSGNFVKEDI